MDIIIKSIKLSFMFTIIQMAVIYMPYLLAKTGKRKNIEQILFVKPKDFIGSGIFLFIVGLVNSSFDNFHSDHLMYTYLGVWISLIFANSYFFIIFPFILKNSGKRLILNTSLQKKCNEVFKNEIPIYVTTSNLMNAFAIGFLPQNKIVVIGKSLIEKLTDDEIFAIACHEQGHHRSNDLLKFFGFMCLAVLCFVTGRDLFIECANYLFTNPDKGLVIGLYGGLHAMIFYIILFPRLSYQAEYAADVFAARHGGALNTINALESLNVLTNDLLTNDSLTHPCLKKRIDNIQLNRS